MVSIVRSDNGSVGPERFGGLSRGVSRSRICILCNVATCASTRRPHRPCRRRRPGTVGLTWHGALWSRYGRLRLGRRVEAFGMEANQSSCSMANYGGRRFVNRACRAPGQRHTDWCPGFPRPLFIHHLHAVSAAQHPLPTPYVCYRLSKTGVVMGFPLEELR